MNVTCEYLDGMIVILLVFLTGAGSFLVASEGPLEFSATLFGVVVEFFLGTGFRFGFTNAGSCCSGPIEVKIHLINLNNSIFHAVVLRYARVVIFFNFSHSSLLWCGR